MDSTLSSETMETELPQALPQDTPPVLAGLNSGQPWDLGPAPGMEACFLSRAGHLQGQLEACVPGCKHQPRMDLG